jgi:hypothetical protein
MIFAISMTTPLVPENQPALDQDGGFIGFVADVNGIPWWAFKTMLLCAIPYVLLFGAISTVPSEFPIDEDKIAKDGIDPDIVELTPKEFGRRTSYDASNELIHRRRSTISAQMKELGLSLACDPEYSEQAVYSSGQRRLSAIVTGSIAIDDVIDELDEEKEAQDLDEDKEVQVQDNVSLASSGL